MILPESDVRFLKGVGDKKAAVLSKLGIKKVRDVLEFYPRAYEDWSKCLSIREAALTGETCCIRVFADGPCKESRIRKGLTIYKTDVTDGETVASLTIFNNKYAAAAIDSGREYLLFGKVTVNKGYYYNINSPEISIAGSGEGIRPIYHQTDGANTRYIEKLVKQAIEQCLPEMKDPLPVSVRERYCLMSLRDAVTNIHFPKNEDYLSEARRRLIFEELLCLRIGMMRLKSKNRQSTECILKENHTEEFLSLLPFTLTGAQLRAVADAAGDMASDVPMNRLLQGDVGSGKTAVAAALIYNAAKNGYQSALMAPTEVLASQHHITMQKFFEGTGIRTGLLLGSTSAKEKKRIKEEISRGETDLVIGTHAIISSDVSFSSLGLVITDEQHRFGVNQRNALWKKGKNPHTLVMSATPIPRTLALIIYGDLDVSILDEMPKGRQKIDTFLIDTEKRERCYEYIKKHLLEGRQGYIVCPLVEEGEENEMQAATELYDSLNEGFFKGFSLGLLHGRMKSAEKKAVMEKFAAGEIDLLISTTVIEVGIDVPNAVIMAVENAERFGLSQLHQLRGRVGRGKHKSTCILISDAPEGSPTHERLKTLVKCADGFAIADADLKMRGPGDFFGSRQHGLPELKIADMMKDTHVINETGECAEYLLRKNPALDTEEFAPLRQAVNRLFLTITDCNN